MRHARLDACLALICLAALALLPQSTAAPTIQIQETEQIVLSVRTLDPALAQSPATKNIPSTGTVSLRLPVHWPSPQSSRGLSIEAHRRMTPAGDRLILNASLPTADPASPVRSRREIAIPEDSTTALFEVARSGESVLTLVVTVERSMEPRYSVLPVVGRPVEFAVAIEWVERGQSVTLETNHLHTFIGQSVSYAFKLGETGEAESIELRLLPVDLVGDTLRVEASVSGTIPDGEDGVELLSKRAEWLCSRGTTSTMSATRGTPERGFRFQVTPRF
jgi:hypothetical protein